MSVCLPVCLLACLVGQVPVGTVSAAGLGDMQSCCAAGVSGSNGFSPATPSIQQALPDQQAAFEQYKQVSKIQTIRCIVVACIELPYASPHGVQ